MTRRLAPGWYSGVSMTPASSFSSRAYRWMFWTPWRQHWPLGQRSRAGSHRVEADGWHEEGNIVLPQIAGHSRFKPRSPSVWAHMPLARARAKAEDQAIGRVNEHERRGARWIAARLSGPLGVSARPRGAFLWLGDGTPGIRGNYKLVSHRWLQGYLAESSERRHLNTKSKPILACETLVSRVRRDHKRTEYWIPHVGPE